MRYLLSFAAAFIAPVCLFAQQHSPLLPFPKKIEYHEGAVPVSEIKISAGAVASQDIRFAIKELKDIVSEASHNKTNSAALLSLNYAIGGAADSTVNPESYTLSINSKGIRVKATSAAGFYYAIQTIRQLIENKNGRAVLPFVDIADEPSIKYRGVMMDFAHGGLLSVDEIKRQIDFLARWKTNQYYFYNEVSIALDGYPSLNYKCSYSQQQIKEIVRYGRQRQMDVIPFVAFYGHLHDLLKQEKYAPLPIGRYGHELDPRNAEVKNILKDWIRQYASMFTSSFTKSRWSSHNCSELIRKFYTFKASNG